MELRDTIIASLRNVIDPELGINIVDLGLIYDLQIDDEGKVYIEMTLTTPGCPMHDTITGGVRNALGLIPEVKDLDINVVWDPPWSPEKISEQGMSDLHNR